MKIGILRETIRKNDARVAIIPDHARKLLDKFKQLEIKIQPSTKRCFSDQDYRNVGVPVVDDLSDCDLLVGVKEVDPKTLFPNKKYVFFAHVAKQQEANKAFFKQLAENKISLIDYEYFTDDKSKRITAFGYWAGIVGAYYAIQAIGLKTKKFNLPNILEVHNLMLLKELLLHIKIPPFKFIVTGNGSTAKGVIELFEHIKIKQVSPIDLNKRYNTPTVCILEPQDYMRNKFGAPFNKENYYRNPTNYDTIFNDFLLHADVFIPCHYWNKSFPAYLNQNTLNTQELNLKVIADISCDLNGPIVSSVIETSHQEPFYDYNRISGQIEKPFSSVDNITTMTIPNLPAALPIDSSIHFSKSFCNLVLPELIEGKNSDIVNRATILDGGKLTQPFYYLYDFLNL